MTLLEITYLEISTSNTTQSVVDTYSLQVHDVRESAFEGHNNISNTSV